MRDLIDILASYEGAIQEDNDEHDDETADRLEKARENLMVVLRQALQVEKYKDALQWALARLDGLALVREGYGQLPEKYTEVRKLAYDE
jgi:DNA repair ATPase RecN